MQAYHEIETGIPADHHLQIPLPDDISPGRVKVAVIYEVNTAFQRSGEIKNQNHPEPQKNLLDFLSAAKTMAALPLLKP